MGKKNFYRDDVEILMRCWWLVLKTSKTAKSLFSLTAASNWFNDERIIEEDRGRFFELMAYSISIVMDKLEDDIKESHGWKDSEYDLHLKYSLSFSPAFEEVFGVPEDKNFFSALIQSYWNPNYDNDYEEFWDIPEIEVTKEDMNKTFGELWRDTEISEEDYNLHKYCTFRMSKIIRITDQEKFLDYIKPYSNIGLPYYDDAFFGLSKTKIAREIGKAYHKR